MSVSSRRTYDTDSIVLRRIFAYDISNNLPFSTGYILTSLTKGVATFLSPSLSLSTIGVPNLPAQLSTLNGEILSTSYAFYIGLQSTPQFFLPSTVTGLGTSGYISTSMLTSTIIGLGSAGYLSTAVLDLPFASTVTGLATSGYVSSTQLFSTVEGLGSISYVSSLSLVSTVEGLGSIGFISSGALGAALGSTVQGLGTADYVSSTQLVSTVEGLGTLGYVSSSYSIFRSTFSNINATNFSNIGYIYSSITRGTTLSTVAFDLGQSLRNEILVSTTKLDIEVKTNLQFGYYDVTSRDYQFNTLLVAGSTPTASTILGIESLSYYVLNANAINLPFFFQEKNRFLITDPYFLSTVKNGDAYSTLTLQHTFGPRVPTTNQLFVSPMSSICATVVLDNTPGKTNL